MTHVIATPAIQFTCPYCNKLNFSEDTLSYHGDFNYKLGVMSDNIICDHCGEDVKVTDK